MVKGALALLLGLFIAQVGMDPLTATPRYTFGNLELMGGISFIPVMIGMFAVSEILRSGRRAMAEVPQLHLKTPFEGTIGPWWKYQIGRAACRERGCQYG